MRIFAAAALLLAACYEPGGQCTADADCLADQLCGADGLCVVGTRPPPGDPPSAAADTYAFQGYGPFGVAKANGVLKNDADAGGATLAAELVSKAGYGEVFLAADGSFTYAPLLAFDGDDAFTYRATNGTLASVETRVTIHVDGPPLAAADAYSVVAPGPLVVLAAAGVLKNDADPDGRALTAVADAAPANGTLTLAADGSFQYTPNAAFTGTDTFTYHATNGTLSSQPATVTITVSP